MSDHKTPRFSINFWETDRELLEQLQKELGIYTLRGTLTFLAQERAARKAVGQYVLSPEHLYGEQVEDVRFDNQGTPHLITWYVLSKEHPDGGRLIVGAEDVKISPNRPPTIYKFGGNE